MVFVLGSLVLPQAPSVCSLPHGTLEQDAEPLPAPLNKIVNGLHLYSAFLTSGHLKCSSILLPIHPFMHTFTQRRWLPTDRLSDAVRWRCLAQGRLDTATFRLTANALYLLIHMPPIIYMYLNSLDCRSVLIAGDFTALAS